MCVCVSCLCEDVSARLDFLIMCRDDPNLSDPFVFADDLPS